MLSQQYEAEQAELGNTITVWRAQVQFSELVADNTEEFLELANKYTDFSFLTTPMINEFIDRILVHAPIKTEEGRTQEVEIFLKYIGKVELPAEMTLQPSAEEMKKREQLRRKHASYRKYYQKKKAEKEAARAAEAIELA